ncbi:DNA mismatch repair endonuclease MutH [Vulgatibacter sp.]|uniref:DNA mismatch repair endonuclease MutH n=1 Tax=Vulgatibacter sp. TaxID=1971226 RepID=UPI003569F6D6
MLRTPAPTTEAELLQNARALAGHPLGLVAERHGVPLADVRRAKGWIGQLLEVALGATASSKAAPDFELIGVELKSVPVDATGKPRETTFVCTAALEEMGEQRWEQSRVQKKLARVLWVPIESDPAIELPWRRVGMPLLWSPDEEEERLLKADWDEFAELVGRGHVEEITAHRGQVLQMRPKGANAAQVRWGVDADGAPVRVAPRGFYLRSTFVGGILRRAFVVAR